MYNILLPFMAHMWNMTLTCLLEGSMLFGRECKTTNTSTSVELLTGCVQKLVKSYVKISITMSHI